MRNLRCDEVGVSSAWITSFHKHELTLCGRSKCIFSPRGCCVQSSVTPSFSHLILLHVGPDCNSSSTLEFEVFSVSDSHVSDASLEKSCKLAVPKDVTSSVVCSLSANMYIYFVCKYEPPVFN